MSLIKDWQPGSNQPARYLVLQHLRMPNMVPLAHSCLGPNLFPIPLPTVSSHITPRLGREGYSQETSANLRVHLPPYLQCQGVSWEITAPCLPRRPQEPNASGCRVHLLFLLNFTPAWPSHHPGCSRAWVLRKVACEYELKEHIHSSLPKPSEAGAWRPPLRVGDLNR